MLYRISIQYSEGTTMVVHNTFNDLFSLIKKYMRNDVKNIEVKPSSVYSNKPPEIGLVDRLLKKANNRYTNEEQSFIESGWPGYKFH